MCKEDECRQAIMTAAQNIRYHINDLQVFVLQPSNRVGEKNKALETTMRIDRLAGAILAAGETGGRRQGTGNSIPEAA